MAPRISSLFSLAIVACAVCSSGGCSLVAAASRSPQSHFTYPNSNVYPLGPAKGSAGKLCGLLVFSVGVPDGDDVDEAIQEALKSKGGDLLINMRVSQKLVMVPPLFSVCLTRVSGTAAKMVVGEQHLKNVSRKNRVASASASTRRQRTGTVGAHRETSARARNTAAALVWYYKKGGVVVGPVSEAAIRHFIRKREFSARTLLKRKSWRAFHHLARLEEFKADVAKFARIGSLRRAAPTTSASGASPVKSDDPLAGVRWHYFDTKTAKPQGPVGTFLLRKKIKTGDLDRSVLVRREGTMKWLEAKRIAGLL